MDTPLPVGAPAGKRRATLRRDAASRTETAVRTPSGPYGSRAGKGAP
ncbi:DUF6380 family protein [Streptomyces sp. NPDC050388]